MQILNEENQDIEFLWSSYENSGDEIEKTEITEDEPEYEELLSLPDDETDFEDISSTDDINDENEYYSDYGEKTDKELQKELPDATGKYNSPDTCC